MTRGVPICEVHLGEHHRQSLPHLDGACSYCSAPIDGAGVRIIGTLDDGTPGELTFEYHEDCVLDMEFDADAIAAGDGCFSYGVPSATPGA